MPAHAAVWWIVAALLVAILAASVVRLAHALGSLHRAVTRLGEAGDLPVLRALAGAERDVERISDAIDRVPPLIVRANAAAAVVRKGPIPPELPAAVARVRAEVGSFRACARY